MKKITLMFFMALCAFTGHAQLATEGFEGSWPPTGWTVLNVAGAAQQWVQGNGGTAQPAYEGTHAAFLNKENVTNGTTSEDWLVTPLVNVPSNGQLRFFSRLTIPADQLSVYRIMVGTDTSALNTWVPLQQWTELELNGSQQEYEEKVVTIPASYTSTSVRFAFVMNGDDGDRWLVDNVSVVEQCLDPTNVVVSNVGLDGAQVSWSGTATSWEIEIVPATQSPTGTGVPYTGNSPYTISGLESNTSYRFFIKAICSEDASSNWVGPANFTTVGIGENCTAAINIASLPYSTTDNTSQYADNYDGIPGTGCATSAWESYLYGNDVVYSYTPDFTGVIDIDLNNAGNYSGIFVYDDCDDIGTSCLAGAVTGWQFTSTSIPTFAVTSGTTYYFVISNYIYDTNPYNLVIQQVNCTPPAGLPTTNIGMTSADLSWTNPSGATSWQIVIQAPGAGIPAGAGTTVTTNTNYAATGLTQATPYEYYVRADCGNGTFSQWAGPYLFNTMICEVENQCTYTFILTDQWDSWNGNTMSVIQNGVTVATLELTTSQGPVEVPVQLCTSVPFELHWNAGGSWPTEVGVAIRNNFGQTFYTKPFGTGAPGTTLYSGDVDCDTPMCLPPEGLTATNITQTTVDLGWLGEDTGNWEYIIVAAGDDAPGADTAGTATTTNPTTVTGLTEATEYEYYVRMVCGEASTSEWAGPYFFSTSVCPVDNKCDYTFTMLSNWWGGWYGANMVISQNGTTVATIGDTFTTGQSQVVTVALCTDTPFEVNWTDGGTYSFQVGLTIVNGFDQTLYTLEYGTESPGGVIYSDTADCDTPACLPPTGVTFESSTLTSATVGWDGPATGNWEYFIVPAGDPAPDATAEGTLTTTNPVVIPDLTIATNYEVYVRILCEGDTSSTWAGPIAVNTQVCAEEDKCTFYFEMTSSFGWGWEGNTMTVFQAGVPVATIGDEFTWGSSMTVEIPLCPNVATEIYWNTTGYDAFDKGLNVYTPFMEDFFTMNYGDSSQGSTVFTGTTSCDPPLCPMPQQLAVTGTTLTTATVEWTEMGSATQWEVIVVPYGADEPLPTESGTLTTDNPYTAENLLSGTPYAFYVRAICGGDNGNSNWAGPVNFTTAVGNDGCDTATNVPVNPGADCDQVVGGTLTGATGSGVIPTCNSWSTPEWDVWYSFTAQSVTQAVSINDAENVYPYFTVYEGDGCGNLTEIYCGFDSATSLSGLTPGQTYYVMVYATYLNDPTAPTSFNVCVTTPTSITVDNTTYTVPEIVTDLLVNSLCATVSNVTWSTGGNDNDSTTGIAMFTQGTSSFGIEQGIALVTGDAMNSAGPNLSTQGDGGWGGDDDLFNYIQDAGIDPGLYDYNDATVVEFDFVPLSTHMKFPFIFASEEYGTFQCSYSDAFAFFLTGPDGNTTNLAVVPETDIPVSVVTIRDNAYNSGCASANPEWFDAYYGTDGAGLPAASAPINYNGVTKKMYAESTVVVGETYHIKLVIADRNDNAYNSAVFIGPFDIGDVDLGADLTVDAATALCSGGSATIDAGLDPEEYSFSWYNGDDLLENETGATLTVTEEGTYTVVAHYFASTCETSDSIVVEFYDPVEVIIADPQNLTECDATGYDEFNLAANTPVVLDGVANPGNYEITYHATHDDAESGENELDIPYTNTTQFLQTVYVRAFNTVTGCVGVKAFDLIVLQTSPQFTVTPDFSICEGTSGTITVTPGNYNPSEVTYSWTLNGTTTLPDTTAEISVTLAGDYEVAVNKGGCIGTATIHVDVTPTPVADDLADVTVCGEYILPVLSANNAYYTEASAGGTFLNAGDAVSTSQEIFIWAVSGTTPSCTSESSFVVTITPAPVVTSPGDQNTCSTYTLPALTVGNYYDDVNGGGNQLHAGDVISSTQTLYVWAQNPEGCTDEEAFTITLIPAPVPDVPADVTACDSYILPVLAAGNSYYTGPGGTGVQLFDGDAISDSQTIYVYAQSATSPVCTAEDTFTVTIEATPVVTTPGNKTVCDGYVLPALTVGNYYTGAGGTGVLLTAGETITTSQLIYVYAATASGCSDEDSFAITVVPYPVADTVADASSCDTFVLQPLTSGSYYTGPGATGTALNAGDSLYETQTVYVYATNGTCYAETSFEVTVVPIPMLSIDLPITQECDKSEFVLTAVFALEEDLYTPDNVTYTWTNVSTGAAAGTGESITITAPGTYEVVVMPEGSTTCSASATIEIDDTSCTIQRGISPGGSAGQNDTFDLSNLDVKKLSIYNRYGQDVYHFNGHYTDQWGGQGSNGDELPTGTYFYMFERTNGESKTGWIYINRGN